MKPVAAAVTDDADLTNLDSVKAIAPLSKEREVAFARDFRRELGPTHLPPYWHHVGLYAYRREALEHFSKLPASAHEKERGLEQMRALDNGMKIAVVRIDAVPFRVAYPADLEAARLALKEKK